MQRFLIAIAAVALTATAGHAQDPVVNLLTKFDKRMDVLDTKIGQVEAQLKVLKAQKAALSPSYSPVTKTNYAPAYQPKTPSLKGKSLPPGFYEIEYCGEIIIIGPPPWALPNGWPPGLMPAGPLGPCPSSGLPAPSYFAGKPPGW